MLVFAGLVSLLAFLMLVSFFFADWCHSEDIDRSISAAGIWFGGNDDFGSLDLENLSNDEAGIGKVRGIDRLLILIPLGAITIIVLAVMIVLEKLPVERTLVNMVLVAVLLFIFPYLWQSLSTSQWRNYLETVVENVDDSLDNFAEIYSTGEQKLLGLLTTMVSLAWLGLYMADRYQFLDRFVAVKPPTRPQNGEEEYLGPPDD